MKPSPNNRAGTLWKRFTDLFWIDTNRYVVVEGEVKWWKRNLITRLTKENGKPTMGYIKALTDLLSALNLE